MHTARGARSAPVVVYMENVVSWGSLHIHQEMVYTSHFHILAAVWRLKNMYFFKGAIPDGTLSSRRVVPHPSSP